jgi:ABC-type proline/glycine betaine transport system ATPase subunit
MILGKTGSGKSTIAQLLLRFYDPDKGSIFIGNKNIRYASLPALRNYISYIPQDIFLFSDTLPIISVLACAIRKTILMLENMRATLPLITKSFHWKKDMKPWLVNGVSR